MSQRQYTALVAILLTVGLLAANTLASSDNNNDSNFLLRRSSHPSKNNNNNNVAVSASPSSSSSSSSPPFPPVYDIMVGPFLQAVHSENLTAMTALFDPDATITMISTGAPKTYKGQAGVQKFWEGTFEVAALFAAFATASEYALKDATAGAIFFDTSCFPRNPAKVNFTSYITEDAIFVTLNPKTGLINRYTELLAPAPYSVTPSQYNKTQAMKAFVTDFIDNMVVKHNVAQLNLSMAPDFFILTSHDDPIETEIIPKFAFLDFIQQDWKDSKFNQYKISRMHVAGDNFVAVEFLYIFEFQDSFMSKAFACYVELEEVPSSPLGFQMKEMIAVETQKYSNY